MSINVWTAEMLFTEASITTNGSYSNVTTVELNLPQKVYSSVGEMIFLYIYISAVMVRIISFNDDIILFISGICLWVKQWVLFIICFNCGIYSLHALLNTYNDNKNTGQLCTEFQLNIDTWNVFKLSMQLQRNR